MKLTGSQLFAALGLLSLTAIGFGAPPVDDLLNNVASLDTGGNPASLIVWGQAEALLAAPDGRIFAAASELGTGRIVAVGHGGFASTDKADSEVFVANAIGWLAGTESAGRAIRIFGLSDPVAAELDRRNVAYERLTGRPGDVVFESIDIIIASPQAFAKANRYGQLEQWLRNGGGLLVTETAWGTLQLNRELNLGSLAANRLLLESGIRFTGESHSGFGPGGSYPVDRSLLPLSNADGALQVLAGERQGDQVFAARIVGNAFGNVPLDSSLITTAMNIARANKTELDDAYRNMAKTRLTPQKHALARALLDLDSRLATELPAAKLAAHPSAVAFPGPLGPERAGDVDVDIDPRIPGWHTTGLYAPPGEVVTVTVAPEAVAAGAVIQIGAWRDPHQHAYRSRMKDAIRRYPIESPLTQVASAIGGPIYIDMPTKPPIAPAATMTMRVSGAAAAPHFKLGVTTVDAWRDSIRSRPAPWAEFESDNLILTVPSSAVRDVERPDLVMEHWDKVHSAMQSLEPRTGNHWADRPYRYVADISVSWGYMYCPADGPIVIPVSAAAAMFQLENFDAQGPNNLWGHYHEMGHSHQNPLWTDGATGEVTVNIFTVYALHAVNGYPLDSEVMRSNAKTAWKTYELQSKSGKKFEEVGGPFERLQLYSMLWNQFGFDAFRTTFERIRNLPASERPRTDTQERNVFLVQFSLVAGKDLSSYFDAWGIDVQEESRERLKELPKWMPSPPEPDKSVHESSP